MNLETNEEITQMFEFYGILLTKIQQQYFNDYYFDDLSLAEIAENAGVSRQAIYDNLKRTVKTLTEYEEKLHLVEIYANLSQTTSELKFAVEQQNQKEITNQITKIEQIIEEL